MRMKRRKEPIIKVLISTQAGSHQSRPCVCHGQFLHPSLQLQTAVTQTSDGCATGQPEKKRGCYLCPCQGSNSSSKAADWWRWPESVECPIWVCFQYPKRQPTTQAGPKSRALSLRQLLASTSPAEKSHQVQEGAFDERWFCRSTGRRASAATH